MQHQFSTAVASFCYKTTLPATFKMVHDAGFDSLDFPFSVYSVGHQAPMLQDNWRDWVKHIHQLSKEYQLPITQAHCAWVQNIPEDFHYEGPWEIYERTLEACAMLECPHLIFHPMRQLQRIESVETRARIHDWNVRWFHDLVSTSERAGVYMNIENTFDSHHVQRNGDPAYPYTTAEDMLSLLRDIGSNRIRLCLDTGHANISGQNIPDMIRKFKCDLTTVHLNDNYGHIAPVYEDLHLFPGNGKIDWKPVLQALSEIRFSGVFNIEPIAELPRMDDPMRLLSLRSGLELLRAFVKNHVKNL